MRSPALTSAVVKQCTVPCCEAGRISRIGVQSRVLTDGGVFRGKSKEEEPWHSAALDGLSFVVCARNRLFFTADSFG